MRGSWVQMAVPPRNSGITEPSSLHRNGKYGGGHEVMRPALNGKTIENLECRCTDQSTLLNHRSVTASYLVLSLLPATYSKSSKSIVSTTSEFQVNLVRCDCTESQHLVHTMKARRMSRLDEPKRHV